MDAHFEMTESAPDVAIATEGISRSYGGVRALSDVGFIARRGEIHALLGENGAGKSTLLKILRGVEAPDSGVVSVKGEKFPRLSPRVARRLGISMIFQEMSLVPTLTVAQNIALANEPLTSFGLIDDRAVRQRAVDIFAMMGVAVDPEAPVGDIGTGQQQLTEIAKALSQNARILILDEPTAALTAGEVDILFDLLRRLKADGVAIIYVSHRMDEIFRIADRASVLRDGRLVGSRPIGEYTLASLIADIMGKSTQATPASAAISGEATEVLLESRDLAGRRGGGASLKLHRGEVVGLAGLLGSGRSHFARMLFGIEAATSGIILVRGVERSIGGPQAAKTLGMALVPEDRRREGLVLQHSIESNIELPNLSRLGRWFLDRAASRSAAEQLMRRLAIRAPAADVPVNTLSGGNQQKVVIAKWLMAEPEILILDEPTAGIDIGSKGEVLRLVRELAAEGKAILFISSELPELLSVSDRIAIMSAGRIVATMPRTELASGARTIEETGFGAEHRLQLILQQGGEEWRT